MRFFFPIRTLLLGWLLSLIAWGTVAFIIGAQFVLNTGEPWQEAARAGARDWLPWAILTPLLFRFGARLPLDRQHWKIALPAHLLCFVVTVGGCFWWKISSSSWRRMGPGGPRFSREMHFEPRPGDPRGFGDRKPMPSPENREPPDWPRDGFGRGPMPPGPLPGPFGGAKGPRGPFGFFPALHLVTSDIPIYLMIMSAAHAALFYRRSQERAASLARARLEALRMQLQPHFLFNTLNTIAGLVHDEPDKADAVLTSLSELLRQTLEGSSELEVPLARELEFVERYLAILHTRFEDRLRFVFDIAEETRAALVPSFLLQPLVENAVRHGLEPKAGGGTVTIRARREGEALQLAVTDDGIGAPDLSAIRENIGLGNTRARLRELYGAKGTLALHNDHGLTVTVTLPFHHTA